MKFVIFMICALVGLCVGYCLELSRANKNKKTALELSQANDFLESKFSELFVTYKFIGIDRSQSENIPGYYILNFLPVFISEVDGKQKPLTDIFEGFELKAIISKRVVNKMMEQQEN